MNLKKVNKQAGFAHLALVIVVLVAIVGALGFVGYSAWQKQSANAGGSSTVGAISVNDCYGHLGRVWEKGACQKKCSAAPAQPGTLVTSNPYDYCSKTASKISKALCDSKNRQFSYGVCLKEWNRQMGAVGYTVACAPHSYVYHVADPYDYCSKK